MEQISGIFELIGKLLNKESIIIALITIALGSYINHKLTQKSKKKENIKEALQNFSSFLEYINPNNISPSAWYSPAVKVPNQQEAMEKILKFKADYGFLFDDNINSDVENIIQKIKQESIGTLFDKSLRSIYDDAKPIKDKIKGLL